MIKDFIRECLLFKTLDKINVIIGVAFYSTIVLGGLFMYLTFV